MDTLKIVLFEEPTWLVILLGAVTVALLVSWWLRRQRKFLLAAAVPAALGGAVLLSAWLVTTDRERIQQNAGAVAADVAAGRTGALDRFVDEQFVGQFQGMQLDKRMALEVAGRVGRNWSIEEIVLKDFDIRVQGNFASVNIQMLVITGQGRYPINMDLLWVRVDGEWRIRELENWRLGVAGGN